MSNVAVGLAGGFPVCHGAGGIAAHARFGGRTGGTTMIIGALFIALSLIEPLAPFLFYIPIPILGALLIFASWNLIMLLGRIRSTSSLVIAAAVGLISFFTRNLTVALVMGLLAERTWIALSKRATS
jgi:SulP family sulfate permease